MVVSGDVNIPGTLVAAKGEHIITKGSLWGPLDSDDTINRLEVINGTAYLRGIKRFNQGYVSAAVKLSADDKLYVPFYNRTDDAQHLAIYPMSGAFVPVSDIKLNEWLSLEDIFDNRAVFTTSGGVLIVNMDDLNNPFAQAFLPMRGWSTDFLLEGNQLTIAAGLYGIYEFDIKTSNLPTP